MATPELVITATLSQNPTTRQGELQALHNLVEMAVNVARGAGGASTNGTVNAAAGQGSATYTYTPNASS